MLALLHSSNDLAKKVSKVFLGLLKEIILAMADVLVRCLEGMHVVSSVLTRHLVKKSRQQPSVRAPSQDKQWEGTREGTWHDKVVQ
jgi:hypothetical protein